MPRSLVGHDSEKLEILLAALRRIWGDEPPAATRDVGMLRISGGGTG